MIHKISVIISSNSDYNQMGNPLQFSLVDTGAGLYPVIESFKDDNEIVCEACVAFDNPEEIAKVFKALKISAKKIYKIIEDGKRKNKT